MPRRRMRKIITPEMQQKYTERQAKHPYIVKTINTLIDVRNAIHNANYDIKKSVRRSKNKRI